MSLPFISSSHLYVIWFLYFYADSLEIFKRSILFLYPRKHFQDRVYIYFPHLSRFDLFMFDTTKLMVDQRSHCVIVCVLIDQVLLWKFLYRPQETSRAFDYNATFVDFKMKINNYCILNIYSIISIIVTFESRCVLLNMFLNEIHMLRKAKTE